MTITPTAKTGYVNGSDLLLFVGDEDRDEALMEPTSGSSSL